jgi:alkylation response protein AidB-like acyl-CoA dehydrogenase
MVVYARTDEAPARLGAFLVRSGAVTQAVELVGNNALTRKNPLERHYRDILCARVHTPQDDSVLLEAGRIALSRVPDALAQTSHPE